MPKFLIPIVAVLLIPSLLVEPVSASLTVISYRPASHSRNMTTFMNFQSQALQLALTSTHMKLEPDQALIGKLTRTMGGGHIGTISDDTHTGLGIYDEDGLLASNVRAQTGYTLLQRVGGNSEADVFAAIAPTGILRAFRMDKKYNAAAGRALQNFQEKLNGDSHSTLPLLYGSGTLYRATGHRTYQIFEFREGQSMMELGKTDFFSRLPLATAFYVIQQILEGIDFLFRHGLYHGDFDYRNIMISQDGRVSFTDNHYGQESPARLLLGIRGNAGTWEEMALYVLEKSLKSLGGSSALFAEISSAIQRILFRYHDQWDHNALSEALRILQDIHHQAEKSISDSKFRSPQNNLSREFA